MDLTRFLSLALAAIAAAGCAHPQLSSRNWKPDYKVHREVLPNGLTVLFVEDHSVPVVSYVTWFKVGSAWEHRGATGIAHLFEHMMFKGTPRYSGKAFFQTLESKGAQLNAFTQRDATVYYEVVASQFLELVIDMESDRMAHLAFSQADLDSERQVVKEERRLRVESNFDAQQAEELEKAAFPDHPYGWPVVGYQQDLDRLSLEECRAFFRNYYQPGNAVITIAGDFEPSQARRWIEAYYGGIQGHPLAPLALPASLPAGKEKRVEIERPVQSESLLLGYYIPSMYDQDAEKLSMLAWSFFGMSSSRANLRLVREKQIALSVSADATLQRFPFLFLVSVEMKSGVPASLGLDEIDALIAQARDTLLPSAEVERVKNRLVYSTVNEAKSPAGVAGWLAGGEFYWGDYQHAFKTIEKYHSITPEDLRDVARKYLRPENRAVVVMKPSASLEAKRHRGSQ